MSLQDLIDGHHKRLGLQRGQPLTADIWRERDTIALERVHDLLRNNNPAYEAPTPDGGRDVRLARTAFMMESLDMVVDAMRLCDGGSLAESLGDLLFAVYGTAVTFGVKLDPVVEDLLRRFPYTEEAT